MGVACSGRGSIGSACRFLRGIAFQPPHRLRATQGKLSEPYGLRSPKAHSAEYALADAGQRVAHRRSPWNNLCVEQPR